MLCSYLHLCLRATTSWLASISYLLALKFTQRGNHNPASVQRSNCKRFNLIVKYRSTNLMISAKSEFACWFYALDWYHCLVILKSKKCCVFPRGNIIVSKFSFILLSCRIHIFILTLLSCDLNLYCFFFLFRLELHLPIPFRPLITLPNIFTFFTSPYFYFLLYFIWRLMAFSFGWVLYSPGNFWEEFWDCYHAKVFAKITKILTSSSQLLAVIFAT